METVEAFLAHAIRIEQEAALRFGQLADAMNTQGNREVGRLFRQLALGPGQVGRTLLVGLDIGEGHGLVVLSGGSGHRVSSIGDGCRQTRGGNRSGRRGTGASDHSRISRFSPMTAMPSTARAFQR